MTVKEIIRENEIHRLAEEIIEKAQTTRGGSACMVPSSSGLDTYRVDVDADYNPVACQCLGGRNNCKHKQATVLFYAGRISALLDSRTNPVYGFYRQGNYIEARVSQMTRAERIALRADETRKAEQAAHEFYHQICDPKFLNGVA